MPLDDVYIHFQYARALAEGHPFQYNPGQPATSGATSLLYPVLLAAGYLVGFQGERLAWWAVGIGILSWIGSAWLVYGIIEQFSTRIMNFKPSIKEWLKFTSPPDPLSEFGEGESVGKRREFPEYFAGHHNSSAEQSEALTLAIAFILTGSLGWAFMSGMETGLMIFATLLTL